MAKKSKVITINRRDWLTGEVVAHGIVSGSNLRDEATGYKCCLGSACRQLGVPASLLNGKGRPAHVYSKKASTLGDGVTIDRLVTVNDDETLTRKQREKKITAGFKKLGYTAVRFIGEYPDYARVVRERKRKRNDSV